VQWKSSANIAWRGGSSPAPVVVRVAAGAAIAGSALIAIIAVAAFTPHAELAARPAPLHRTAASQPRPAPPVEAEPASTRFTGRVGQNLSDSLHTAGVPELLGRQYVALLGRAIPLAAGLSVDDRFDLIVERKRGGALGQLLYVGLDRVARSDVELLKWTDGRSIIWVNADGVGGQDSSGMSLPVHGRMTSGFGNRFHPILGYQRFHAGVDLAVAAGTPILAAADGRVLQAGWHGGYGQEVELTHGGGLESRYGHMSRIAARIGEVVRKGQVIGWVGSTGLSTGPHVHFEVTRNGSPVNPLTVKMDSGPGHLEGEKLLQFDGALRGLLLGAGKIG
jgi:murein DD-endopeptidase MepM/ murein hydrolase activator NlpD